MQIIAILILQCAVAYAVVSRQVSLLSVFAWLGSIALTAGLFKKKSATHLYPKRRDINFLIVLSIVQLVVLWYFGNIPTHYHQDEFITAYTSWTLPEITKIDWFAAYPAVWVSQFPVLFHLLQKPFFWLFGPSVAAVRISVWPYAIGILVYLYYFVRIHFARKVAVIACIVYIFFVPHLYLSSMGLHFISSTFFYIAAITHFVRGQFVAAGIFSGLSYLTYTSSYVTYPVIVLLGITHRKSLVTTTLMMLLVVSPFLVYAAGVNNFFFQRVTQVNAIWGTWSDPVKRGESAFAITAKQTVDALRALAIPGVGGIGGYNFGKLALLDRLTAILFILGFLIAVRNWTILIATLVPFVAGYILTTHPPAFHRLAIVYPFMALIIGLVVARGKLKYLIPILIITNILQTRAMIKNDTLLYSQNSRLIAEYLVKNIPPGEAIQIAAYPSFYLGQELLFRTNNAYRIRSAKKEDLLASYDGGALIILNANKEQLDKLKVKYPGFVVLTSIAGISLGDLTLFVSSRG